MIRVYGKKGCSECDKLKEWLTERGLEFEFYDVVDFGERWRESGVVDAMAESSYFGGILPIVRLEGGKRGVQYVGGLSAKRQLEVVLRRK